MGTTLLPAGTIGFDCAEIPDYLAAYNSGKRFHSMYLGNRYGVKPWQVRAAIDAGLVVIWNEEGLKGDALNGEQAGRAAARKATNIAASFGWNGETGIIYSGTDTGITPAEYSVCDEYYYGAWDEGGRRQTGDGAYGPGAYLRHLWAQPWKPYTYVLWHWAGDHAIPEYWTDVQQLLMQEFYGCTIDLDRIERPLYGWNGPTPNPPKEDDMADFRHASDGAVYQIANGYKYHLSGEYFYGVLGGQLGESGVVSEWNIYSRLVDSRWLDTVPLAPTSGGTGPTTIALHIPGVPGDATGTLS